MAEAAAAARTVPFDAVVFSVLLEQEKQLAALERRLHELETRAGEDGGGRISSRCFSGQPD
ncbi:MAG: hypothetical protein JJU11_12160, partial [Candidatus Sumerlaeia bacterium]|nr:hypothetical protein [Candidatus Sumerlaeia bacterium]